MSINFKNIPAGGQLRVPLFYAEVDASQANSASQLQRTLIIGQMLTASTETPNVPSISAGAADAQSRYGNGSMLAQMVWAYQQNDSFGEVWCLPLNDATTGGVAATGSIAFAGTATEAGVLSLYVAGRLISTTVTSGMTAAQLATAVVAAAAQVPNLPVSCTVDGTTPSKVDFTALNAGLAGNDIDIRLNYLGSRGGQATPAGITPTITAMSGGATNPSLTAALANLGDEPFDFVVSPYTDATSIAALTALLNDVSGRWSWEIQVFGHVFCAYRGTYGALTTFGTGLNDQHTSCIGFYDSPSPVWAWAAATAGAAAVSLRADPGLPLQTLQIQGVLAPPLQSRFTLSQRNTLLFDGISTFKVDDAGAVSIENLITTYQKNAFGQADNSYLQVETMFLLMFLLRDMASLVTTKYGRVKLAQDGTRFGPGANVVTPSTVAADIIALYQQREYEGYVQNSAAFAAGLVVQINSSNPNRLDVLWDGILIDGLRQFALLAQFRNS
jgi:phage tail sheath gpL-like